MSRSRSRSYSSDSNSDSDSSFLGRRAGWRPDLGPLSNPLLRSHVSLSVGLGLIRQDPDLRQLALEVGLLSETEVYCERCHSWHLRYHLTGRGLRAWGAYKRELLERQRRRQQ